jgi:LacI family transcriptional regulator
MSGLKDIALRTQLSMNTVSRALRGQGYVSAESARKVLSVAAELGYRPSRAARSLRFKRNFKIVVIGMLSPDSKGDQLMLEKIAGIKRQLTDAGYEMILTFFYTGEQYAKDNLQQLDDLTGENPDGIIIIGDTENLNFIYSEIEHREIAAVMISYDAVPGIDCVYIDREEGVYTAVRYLFECGRRNIAFAGYTNVVCNRIKGYRRAVADLGLKEKIFVMREKPQTLEDIYNLGMEQAEDIMRSSPVPDAIVAYSDYLAAGLLSGFRRLSVKVPEEIALIGFDNRELSLFTSPPLTTVSQPCLLSGEKAAEIVLQKINGNITGSRFTERIEMQLVVRQST